MANSRGLGTGVPGAAATLMAVIACSVLSPAAGANTGREPVASQGDAGSAVAASAAPRCLTWRRRSPTKAYDKGRTAGYSWAWNGIVGPKTWRCLRRDRRW